MFLVHEAVKEINAILRNSLRVSISLSPLIIESIHYLKLNKAGVDNDFSFEPHLALFMKLQEAYPEYEKQFSYA
jgi:hypothetical protein